MFNYVQSAIARHEKRIAERREHIIVMHSLCGLTEYVKKQLEFQKSDIDRLAYYKSR